MSSSSNYQINHLRHLEEESIFIIREASAMFSNLALLFSGGKDSIVMVHLARKAFFPSCIPFPLLHVDTGHNFPETLDFRDKLVSQVGAKLIVKKVEDTIRSGKVMEEKGNYPSRNSLQSVTLMDAIEELKLDACFGGGRRDEEKARAKERVFSHRDEFGQWNPKNQRPELWSLFNGRKNNNEHFRVFPLSNWTELDVWNYIRGEKIEVPSIYFSHEREVFSKDGTLYSVAPFFYPKLGEKITKKKVRFRTIGDVTCTGAVDSEATSLDEVINEIAASRVTERGTRADDKKSETAMEDRKKQGYF